jgi:hypothetical protein
MPGNSFPSFGFSIKLSLVSYTLFNFFKARARDGTDLEKDSIDVVPLLIVECEFSAIDRRQNLNFI